MTISPWNRFPARSVLSLRRRLSVEPLEDRSLPSVNVLSPTVGGPADGDSVLAATSRTVVSQDGRYTVFQSQATRLVVGQTESNTGWDVFLRDRVTGTTTLLSRSTAGAAVTGNGDSVDPTISADGRYIAFRSKAADLVSGVTDLNGKYDVFLHDRLEGITTLVSRSASSPLVTGDGDASAPTLSGDGSVVVYASTATNLAVRQEDANGKADVFLFDRVAETTTLVSHGTTDPATAGNAVSDSPSVDSSGRYSGDPDQPASTLTYTWDLDGDGLFGEVGRNALRGDETGLSPTFSAVGLDGPRVLPIALRVTDDTGAEAMSQGTVTVLNVAPVAHAGGPYSVFEWGTVRLTGAASDAGGDALTYEWDLDGDGLFGETGASAPRGDETGPTPTFSAVGIDGPATRTVRLRVRDKDGALSVESSATVNVLNAAPMASVGGPYTVTLGGSVVLNGLGSDVASFLDPLTFAWDLDNDGQFGETGANALHGDEVGLAPTFSSAGLVGPRNHPISFRVSDDDGGATTVTTTVFIPGVPSIPAAPATPAPASLQRVRALLVSRKKAQFLMVINTMTGAQMEVRLFSRRVAGGVLFQVADVNGDGIEDVVVLFRRQAGPVRVVSGEGRVLAVISPAALRKMQQSGGVGLELRDAPGGSKKILLRGRMSGKPTTLVFDGRTGQQLEQFRG